NAARVVKSAPTEVADKLEKLLEKDRMLEREVQELKKKLAMGGSAGGGIDEMLRGARDVPGGKALAVRVDSADAATLRELAQRLRDKLGAGVVLVGSASGGKASLVLAVSKELTSKYKAGELIRPIAQVLGGSGGGRPDMAQAGGTAVDKLDEALAGFYGA